MASELMRLYVGSNELEYADAVLEMSNDTIIDEGRIDLIPDTNLTNSSLVRWRQVDGTTNIFQTQVEKITKETTWNAKVYGLGFELTSTFVEQVYENTTPEAIVQDLVDNYSATLTYAGTASSGVVIEKYIAQGYAIDIIKEFANALQWQVRTDASGNFYFEPKANIDNGAVFDNSDPTSNIRIYDWNEDKSDMINKVRVKAGFKSFATEETINDTNTVFNLSRSPNSTVMVMVSGAEVNPSNYQVDPQNKTITFTLGGARTDPTFFYSYDQPIVVTDQNDASIATHKERFREVELPGVTEFSTTRKYAKGIIAELGTPGRRVKVERSGFHFDVSVNEIVEVNDVLRNENHRLVVQKIIYDALRASTTYELGRRSLVMYDWTSEAAERIKKLERRLSSNETIVFARSFVENLTVTLTSTTTGDYRNMNNTATYSHRTLGIYRPSDAAEADCSGTGNNGFWQGTGIDGSQFTTDGHRLSAGNFNGSDNYVQVSDDASLQLSSDLAICLVVQVSSLPNAETYLLNKWDGTNGYAVRINASNQVELIYSDSGADSVITATTALTVDTWQHIVFSKSGTDLTVYVNGAEDNTGTGGATIGTNSNNLEIGRYSSNYFTGKMDEVRIYDSGLTDDQTEKIYSKIQVLDNLKGYYSFDAPVYGDHRGSRVAFSS